MNSATDRFFVFAPWMNRDLILAAASKVLVAEGSFAMASPITVARLRG